jgi:hypothetical protein
MAWTEAGDIGHFLIAYCDVESTAYERDDTLNAAQIQIVIAAEVVIIGALA